MISTSDKEIVKKCVLPSEPEQWHADLALIRNKNNSIIKEIVTILENFEDHERKLDVQKRNDFYIKTTNIMGIVKTIVTEKTKTKARARVELQGIATSRKIAART